ncbi:MAG: hypothetical protein M3347_18610 [Armatimonadota bacterium]|nr:hypothetical protein [Armatimonadota bacterium]
MPKLYFPLLLALGIALAWKPLSGYDDFWAHAAVGRWIWQHQSVPQHTLFLWSVDPPVRWIAHSWLTQLTYYGFMALGGEHYGPYIALLFGMLVVTLTFIWMWSLWTRRAPVTSLMALIFALAISVASSRFRVRPELFSALFLTCLLAFLIGWSSQRRAGDDTAHGHNRKMMLPALGVVPLFALWANFHGAVALGLMILTATVLCDLLQDDLWGGRFPSPAWRLALICLLCVGAIFVNPYGAEYWQALKPVTSRTFAEIDEWKPFWKHPALGYDFAFGALMLLYLAFLAWSGNPQRRWSHLAWLLLIGAAFLGARRHLWSLALICLAVMAYNAASLDTRYMWRSWCRLWSRRNTEPADEQSDESPPMPVSGRRALHSVVVIFLLIGIARSIKHDVLPLHAVSRYLPTRAARSLDEHNLQGRMFNDYEDSSYLHWHFAERRPRYIDLLNAYPDQLLMDYFDVLEANARGRRLLDQLNISHIFLRRHKKTETLARLKNYLNKSPRWERIYAQADATIWRRRAKTVDSPQRR